MKLSIIHEISTGSVGTGVMKPFFTQHILPKKSKIKYIPEGKYLSPQVKNKVTVGYPPAKTLGSGESGAYDAPDKKPIGFKRGPTGKPQTETFHTYGGSD